MLDALNFMLVSLHKALYPVRGAILIFGILYLVVTGFYYQWRRSKDAISQKKIVRKAILQSGLAAIIASYGVALEVQEQYFLDHLFLLLPICILVVPSLLVLFLWIGFYFTSKSNSEIKPE